MVTTDRYVSCVMPTMASRRWCLPHAIRYWQRQTYQFSELVVMTDGADPGVEDLIPADPRIRYVHVTEALALSDKYNRLVEQTRYPWIALWADDDWQASWRLGYTMGQLRERREIAGLRKMIFHRIGTLESWLYETPKPTTEPYFLGGSIVFHRQYWERHPFPSGKRSRADASFTNDIDPDEYARVAVVLEDPTFYVAMNHGNNVGRSKQSPLRPEQNHVMGWSWYDGDVRNLLGDDAEIYCPRIRS